MPDCPVCSEPYDIMEIVTAIQLEIGDDPDYSRVCCAGYTKRNDDNAVRVYFHE